MTSRPPPHDVDVPVFVAKHTLRCVCSRCRVCAHAVAGDNWSLPFPNARPEECHTTRGTLVHPGQVHGSPFCGGLAVLTLGDGNLSFSRSLAEHVLGLRLTATCFEDRARLASAYGEDFSRNEEAIRGAGDHTVLHGVDATALVKGPLPANARFDRVVWNFPCVPAEAPAADGQAGELEANRTLMRGFFRGVGARLAAGGEVHVTHKMRGPFAHWGLVRLAAEHGLRCRGCLVFSRAAYPGYQPRKVFDGTGFPTSDARTFVFVREGDGPGTTLPPDEARASLGTPLPRAAEAPTVAHGTAASEALVRPNGRARVHRASRKRARRLQVRDAARAARTKASAEAAALALDAIPFWRPDGGGGGGGGTEVAPVDEPLLRRMEAAFAAHTTATKSIVDRADLRLPGEAAGAGRRRRRGTGAGDREGGSGDEGSDPGSDPGSGKRARSSGRAQELAASTNAFAGLAQDSSDDSGSDDES